MGSIVYLCHCCSEKKHDTETEHRLCQRIHELYYKDDLTSEEVFEYVNLKDQLDSYKYIAETIFGRSTKTSS